MSHLVLQNAATAETSVMLIYNRRMKKVVRVAGTGKAEVRARSWWEIDRLEDLGSEGRMILKSIFKKKDGWSHSRFICLRIRASGELL